MGAFIDRVRRSKIPQPTQRTFSAQVWREEFELTSEPDVQDSDLFEAGLFIDEILGGLRQKLAEGRFQSGTRVERLAAICGLINHEVAVLKIKVDEEMRRHKRGSTVSSVSLAGQTVTLRSGIKVTPDQLITTLIDSAVYPLDEALQSKEPGAPVSLTLDDVGLAFTIATQYRVASELWAACLWGDKFVERAAVSKRHIIRPRDTAKAKQVAVSEHRNETIHLALTNYTVQLWRKGLSLAQKKALATEKGVTAYNPDKQSQFRVEKLNSHRRRHIPSGVHRWTMANEGYLSPFIRIPLPGNQLLTLERLNQVWQVLVTLVQAVLARIPEQANNYHWFLAHAIRLPRAEICNVLLRSLPFDTAAADAAIEFLTYQPRSDGLWQKPLIPVGADEYLIASAPLLYGNMLRIAERWLRQGGFDLDKRGPIFEKDAREQISKMLETSRLLRDAAVAPEPVFVGPSREEVDLLVRIGKVLLVGEAKCQLFPVDEIERYRFQQRLLEGAQQAIRKSDAVRSHPADVRAAVGMNDLENLLVLPFVLSNSILYSGYPVDNVAVVDLSYLGTLLRDGGLRTMVVMNREGEKDPGTFREYYSNQADAETRLPDLLMHQPVVEIFAGLVEERIRPMPISAGETEIFEQYYASSTGDNPFDWEFASAVVD